MLLRRERERVRERAPVLLARDELEPADRVGALDQLVLAERQVVEVGPPLRLLLAPVVLEQVREQPARLAFLRVREQLGLDPRTLLEPRLRLFLDLALLRRLPPLQILRTQVEQPAVQLVERAAVVLVVGADLLEDRVLTRLEPLLERNDRAASPAHLVSALEVVERLDLLDRVAVEREPKRLANDLEEIDQHPAAQQVVELGLTRSVLAHQPLQRRAFVGRVVVDVHARVARAPLADQIEQPLEARLLLGPVEPPDAVVLRLAVVVEVDPAEQVLEPALRLVPGVALEVEPDVARRRLGQKREPALGLDREHDVLQLAGLPAVELEPGLLVELRERLGAELRDLGLLCRRETRERGDVGGREPIDLRPPDPRDEREVVVALPLLLAAREELAERAVVDRVRVGRLPVLDHVEEPLPQPAVVREEVVRPEALPLAEPVDDVHRAPASAPESARPARCRSRAEGRATPWRGARAWCRRPRTPPSGSRSRKSANPCQARRIVKRRLVDDVSAVTDRIARWPRPRAPNCGRRSRWSSTARPSSRSRCR